METGVGKLDRFKIYCDQTIENIKYCGITIETGLKSC